MAPRTSIAHTGTERYFIGMRDLRVIVFMPSWSGLQGTARRVALHVHAAQLTWSSGYSTQRCTARTRSSVDVVFRLQHAELLCAYTQFNSNPLGDVVSRLQRAGLQPYTRSSTGISFMRSRRSLETMASKAAHAAARQESVRAFVTESSGFSKLGCTRQAFTSCLK